MIVVRAHRPARRTAEPPIAVDDVDCLLAARFGAIRLYSETRGAAARLWWMTRTLFGRSWTSRRPPIAREIDRAVGRLRQQLREQNVSFGY